MKMVNLTRIGGSGIYSLPADVTIKDVLDIMLDGKQIGFNRYKVLSPTAIDIFDSDLSNESEMVVAEI